MIPLPLADRARERGPAGAGARSPPLPLPRPKLSPCGACAWSALCASPSPHRVSATRLPRVPSRLRSLACAPQTPPVVSRRPAAAKHSGLSTDSPSTASGIFRSTSPPSLLVSLVRAPPNGSEGQSRWKNASGILCPVARRGERSQRRSRRPPQRMSSRPRLGSAVQAAAPAPAPARERAFAQRAASPPPRLTPREPRATQAVRRESPV